MKARLIISFLILLGTNLWGQTHAIVDVSAGYIRENPSFTAELGTQSLMGSIVEILPGGDGYWIHIRNDEPYEGYITHLSLHNVSDQELDTYKAAPKIIVTARHSALLAEPKQGSQMLSDLVDGDILVLKKACRNWYQASTPSGVQGYVCATDAIEQETWLNNIKSGWSDFAANIEKTAKLYLGTPYLWGGECSKGFDCSGLSRHVFLMNGVLLPRNASQQAKSGQEVEVVPETPLPLRCANLSPGDLIFFGTPAAKHPSGRDRVTHVGIYLGNGQFIHSAQKVRINSLYPDDANFYDGAERFFKARRCNPNTCPAM